MTRPKRTVVAALTLLSCSGIGFALQSEAVEWEHAEGVGRTDREAILQLARRLGIQQPRLVSFTAYLPTACQFVRVESGVTVEGNRRTWLELRLRRQDWRECTRVPRFSTRREGRWIGSGAELSTEELWRIADGDWVVDIRLGPNVRYDDAKRIVLAIRQNTLVNRLSLSIGPLKLNPIMPTIDANEIVSVNAVSSDQGTYQVLTGRGASGDVYEVRIRDGTVELHRHGTWIVRLERPPHMPLQLTSGAGRVERFETAASAARG
jgi:hypothetical protein